jgi:hypothetical protein
MLLSLTDHRRGLNRLLRAFVSEVILCDETLFPTPEISASIVDWETLRFVTFFGGVGDMAYQGVYNTKSA